MTTKNTRFRRAIVPALLLIPLAAPAFAQSGAAMAAIPEDLDFDFGRWPYPLYAEVSERMEELAARYPRLARVRVIGESREGQPLRILEITNADTGPGEAKPGLWLDGNIHAREVTGRPLLRYFAEAALASYGSDPIATEMLDTRVFYVMPVFDVDAGEAALTRHPAWPGHRPEQHDGQDLDGDGYLTQMRIPDPEGAFYPSPRDPRLMLRVRDRTGGRWNFVPTTLEEPDDFTEDLAPPERRYRVLTEGARLDPPVTDEREETNYNRNWSAEWQRGEPGAGPYPFYLPEVRAVAEFITTHPNIFFTYTIHSGGGARNYIVRPPMSHPFEYMPPEDNDFYTRVGGIWSALSNGGVMNNNYYAQEVKAGRYGETMHGFSNDWAYMQVGIHSLLPEIGGAGRDYDRDGYVTQYEILRWNDEEHDGRYFADWTPFEHPELGTVEIGGYRGLPQGVDDRLRAECEIHYRYLMHLAGLSPLLRVEELRSEPLSDTEHRVTATLRNHGWLSTYVTRKALEIRLDYPILARIRVEGGEVVEGRTVEDAGHILGQLAYYRRWGSGADESRKTVSWTVRGAGPMEVTVSAQARRAGRDERTITVGGDPGSAR